MVARDDAVSSVLIHVFDDVLSRDPGTELSTATLLLTIVLIRRLVVLGTGGELWTKAASDTDPTRALNSLKDTLVQLDQTRALKFFDFESRASATRPTALRSFVNAVHKIPLGGDEPALARAVMRFLDHVFHSSQKRAQGAATPPEVAELMVALGELDSLPAEASICDPCCGAGVLLAQAHVELGDNAASIEGQELNAVMLQQCRIVLELAGASRVQLALGDTLREPALVTNDRLRRYDRVLADPPHSMRWRQDGEEQLPFFEERFSTELPPARSSELAFLLHALATLKPEGRAVLLLSEAFLTRGGKERLVRQALLEQQRFAVIVTLPPGVLYNTSLRPVIVIMRGRAAAREEDEVLLVDASRLVERERPGRRGVLSYEHKQAILTAVRRGEDTQGCAAQRVSLAAIKRAGYTLSPNRLLSRDDAPTDEETLTQALGRVRASQAECARWQRTLDHLLESLESTDAHGVEE